MRNKAKRRGEKTARGREREREESDRSVGRICWQNGVRRIRRQEKSEKWRMRNFCRNL